MPVANRRSHCALTAGLAAAALPWLALAGSLTPPPGPIQPTMRTLGEVEPRRPVQAMTSEPDAVWVLTQAGEYYLTDHVEVPAGKHGIVIAAPDVSVDLNGFTIYGQPSALSGIVVRASDPPRANVRVRNGNVVGAGVDLRASIGGAVEGLGVSQAGGVGIYLGKNMTALRCIARGGGGHGIVSDEGAVIRDCHVTDNGGSGVWVNFGGIVSNTIALRNGGSGIECAFGGTVTHCTAMSNSLAGVALFTAGTAAYNTCAGNREAGIRVNFDCQVTQNNVSFNLGVDGIFVYDRRNRIDGNVINNNGRAVFLQGPANLFIRNSMTGNTTGLSANPGNAWGPIVNVAGAGDISAAPGAAHPWANLQH